jgi:hypothetical protein
VIVLNHTIVRASNKNESARFFADLVGLTVGNPSGPFAPVRVNGDLTFDFDDRQDVVPGTVELELPHAPSGKLYKRHPAERLAE